MSLKLMKNKVRFFWYQVINGFWSFMIILIFYFTVLDTSVEISKWIKLLPTQAEFLFTDMRDLIISRESTSSEHTSHSIGYFIEIMKEVKSSSYYGGPIGGDLV